MLLGHQNLLKDQKIVVVCHDPSGFDSWLYAMTQVALFLGCMRWPKWLCFLVVCHDPSGFVSWLYAMKWLLFLEEPYSKWLCIFQGNCSLNWSFLHTYLLQSKDQRRFRYSFFVCSFFYASVITLNTPLFGILVPLWIGGGAGEEYLPFFSFIS